MPGFFILYLSKYPPMKITAFQAWVCCLLFLASSSTAQSISPNVEQSALTTATQFVNAFKSSDWKAYNQLSYPGVVKYYGGPNGFNAHIQRARQYYGDTLLENPETVKLIQLLNDYDEWQCVMEKTRDTYSGVKRMQIRTYIVGISADDGKSWTFFDASFNSLESIPYIMPNVFGMLAIPQRQVLYPDQDQMVHGSKMPD